MKNTSESEDSDDFEDVVDSGNAKGKVMQSKDNEIAEKAKASTLLASLLSENVNKRAMKFKEKRLNKMLLKHQLATKSNKLEWHEDDQEFCVKYDKIYSHDWINLKNGCDFEDRSSLVEEFYTQIDWFFFTFKCERKYTSGYGMSQIKQEPKRLKEIYNLGEPDTSEIDFLLSDPQFEPTLFVVGQSKTDKLYKEPKEEWKAHLELLE